MRNIKRVLVQDKSFKFIDIKTQYHTAAYGGTPEDHEVEHPRWVLTQIRPMKTAMQVSKLEWTGNGGA